VQQRVLAWIASGCPDGEMAGQSFKVSAVALQNRRLVRIARKGCVWSATPTEDGIFFLEHGTFPVVKSAREDAGRGKPTRFSKPSVDEAESIPKPSSCSTPNRPALSRVRALSKSEQLIADLVASGGELVIDAALDRANYATRVAAAIRCGKVPPGKVLTIDGCHWSRTRTVRLLDAPAWLNEPLDAILVPTTLRRPHPVVVALRERDSSLARLGSLRQRALLLIQALATAADDRGATVVVPTQQVDYYGRPKRSSTDADLLICSHGFTVDVRVERQDDRAPTWQRLSR